MSDNYNYSVGLFFSQESKCGMYESVLAPLTVDELKKLVARCFITIKDACANQIYNNTLSCSTDTDIDTYTEKLSYNISRQGNSTEAWRCFWDSLPCNNVPQNSWFPYALAGFIGFCCVISCFMTYKNAFPSDQVHPAAEGVQLLIGRTEREDMPTNTRSASPT